MRSQTIQQARRLATQADTSERQADAYDYIAASIQDAPFDEYVKRAEIVRFNRLAEEFYADADELRGQVEPELIDQL